MQRLLAIALLGLPLLALAEPSPATRDSAQIDASASYQGNLSLNQAAGDLQQQANSRSLSFGDNSHSSTSVRQQLQANLPAAPLDASARIGDAFHGSGTLGVNQAAGVANQQINALRISVANGAVDAQGLDDSVLAQSVALANPSGSSASASGARVVTTDDRAFAGSRGVVQVNQSAGIGNQTSNNLSIRVAGGP